ncbi:GyrI-like domain-containing protein [Streptomyces inhibens]|uniref:GyrI-like domain-containing protein n=1 Tax=Streptomyces inhibens TaxID=2293571 RepID=UPI00402A92DB
MNETANENQTANETVNDAAHPWYTAADEPELAEFGPVRGLGVTGQGAPDGGEYGVCAQALYVVAGALPVPHAAPLEGRWWVEDPRPPLDVPRARWRWHLFLRLPDDLDPALADRAREAARPSGAAVDRVQLVTFTEGRCVQMTHHGAYADEPASLARMDAYMAELGLVRAGLHHEIYLSDVRESDPARMRTILRQPVRPA